MAESLYSGLAYYSNWLFVVQQLSVLSFFEFLLQWLLTLPLMAVEFASSLGETAGNGGWDQREGWKQVVDFHKKMTIMTGLRSSSDSQSPR
ncbi:hypothetical protein [Marinobacterium nitratireducens]|uniref:hypothetical protein n=1 Tax=Marinobacterium nitratireducens TaxID=518897 RepID=UPI001668F6BB|nr:hypothetical protein [Marinobacterium nitratireducens]